MVQIFNTKRQFYVPGGCKMQFYNYCVYLVVNILLSKHT